MLVVVFVERNNRRMFYLHEDCLNSALTGFQNYLNGERLAVCCKNVFEKKCTRLGEMLRIEEDDFARVNTLVLCLFLKE